jgi:hypothetical protein
MATRLASTIDNGVADDTGTRPHIADLLLTDTTATPVPLEIGPDVDAGGRVCIERDITPLLSSHGRRTTTTKVVLLPISVQHDKPTHIQQSERHTNMVRQCRHMFIDTT